VTYEDILHLTAKILYQARHAGEGNTYPLAVKKEPGLEDLHHALAAALRTVFNMPLDTALQIAEATATEPGGKIIIDTDVLADATDRWIKCAALTEKSS
jgi:predicted dinucleotide-binding enzyme